MDKVEELIYECDCAKQEAREEFAAKIFKIIGTTAIENTSEEFTDGFLAAIGWACEEIADILKEMRNK